MNKWKYSLRRIFAVVVTGHGLWLFGFTRLEIGPMLRCMLLIVTALAEEMETVLNLCRSRTKVKVAGMPVWKGVCAQATWHLARLGVGPDRAASALERILAASEVSQVMAVGYAGALDPQLKQGDLVVVDRAHSFAQDTWGAPLDRIGIEDGWNLAHVEELLSLARAGGLAARTGAVLTSRCVIGSPEQKRILFRRFGAALVDMETAALARAAARAGVHLSCVRAVSDTADDEFLAFLSYEPEVRSLERAAKILAAGSWKRRYSQWRERSAAARMNLGRFMRCCLKSGIFGPVDA